ncbi:MAG: bifunctional glutamate N-acetyltransferase/amino-acid acetyltransferase ArgJ [Sedimenticola sp.]|uniref:Arginine biosynthesis bifunctional protein ArgJ n=1 Tax=Sedimenticola thiotaurini TaxID=1543721 RepID=A0A558DCC8_9GAMM|nr:bifunctional glutamate N-acetyltransferase/amino-acid acetyltransferase ArgJ [Sedimenticola sp.]MCW8921485.1 bifunctional glutamate N-acetyltransferase/amino-acid acetyltransferase ArgJ [Sedimenticola sp.]MCW8948042.1 bifunctional glutamate N-acetyltransferase/amino-acid acetyltransferase ArgJ [Sedimenticola sp.]MCW8950103.1 bifunctional glutamate N-acetyltransferase/amino-acid acetyltransferase ArgJ [Sedimenticola sp.]TVT58636.1 MAG: bifunctional glutamate N-acetyltransferase/amino-acid ace
MGEELAFYPVAGVRLGATCAGIKYRNRNDLVIIELAEGGSCAAVFTRNAFCAAPVTVAKEHLAVAMPRYLLINSGNANAGTGEPGRQAAIESCKAVAATRGCAINQVLPFSTGVIGELLPVDKVAVAVPDALTSLTEQGWATAARAIMTTDTVAKISSHQIQLSGKTITITGIAKGSGMIRPDMATMLAYIATDAMVDRHLLQRCLEQSVQPSFNSITVDGDTSTNDACVLMASGVSESSPITDEHSQEYNTFCSAVETVCMDLARAIVLDGEGATKLVEVLVQDAGSEAEARDVAYTIAHSPLVKTALFASDPNWGRILAAVGRAGLEDLAIDRIKIWLDDVCIVREGGRAADYTEAAGQRVMSQDALTIRVSLGRGMAETRILTCDLSYDYVKINAEYRS